MYLVKLFNWFCNIKAKLIKPCSFHQELTCCLKILSSIIVMSKIYFR